MASSPSWIAQSALFNARSTSSKTYTSGKRGPGLYPFIFESDYIWAKSGEHE
ncbi:MAG: hypothetical protein WA688_02955 [Thermoplasmata archaeon]